MSDPGTENRDLWDAWSDQFQALWNADTATGDLPPAPFPLPEDGPDETWQADVLPEIEGADFVELGCGGGQATVGAARAGVDAAVGVDFSTEQLRHAERLGEFYGVDAAFVVGDVTAVPLADDAFDVAFSGWVYFMVEDLASCLAEARRVLREDGLLVFDVPHPFYELFDPDSRELERSYHASGPRRNVVDEDYDADMVVFDRKVSELHNALVDAGFTVERIIEEGSDDPEDYDDDPLESNQPDLMAMVPRSLRFWATPA